MSKAEGVIARLETLVIPTYPSPAPEEMPIFAEFRNHQGTSGNPYPNRPVIRVDREHRADRSYEAIRLENEFLLLYIIPELGGRIFTARDKKTGYDFLYQQHVIKPALIGALGSWISGGLEFNWPFHHRPSTFMPVDYAIETEADGTAIVWLSEHDPFDRTKGMVGIVLSPGKAYFETRAKVTNRTPLAHSFLWWENAAVPVNEEYQLFFPPDVSYARHHYRRGLVTFPVTTGEYGGVHFDEPTDISMHKNSIQATSYFSAASKHDYFGGYDHGKSCGVIHVANHHTSPGKKMFTWGYSPMSKSWENALTDTDGAYAELMASSFSDNQPDFTWIEPYETKNFSQFWYPIGSLGVPTYATLDVAVALDREAKSVRVQVTREFAGARLVLSTCCGKAFFDKTFDAKAGETLSFALAELPEGKASLLFTDAKGKALLRYTEEDTDELHMPKNFQGVEHPSKMRTAQELFIAGLHLDQYRDPTVKPDVYWLEALKRDPEYLPALTHMARFLYARGEFACALTYLEKAKEIENRYNTNPADGTIGYLLGLTLFALGRDCEAYDSFYKAAWSGASISRAMTFVSAIDGRRGDFELMRAHAVEAMEHEAEHPVASVYAALAAWKLGEKEDAEKRLSAILSRDPLSHFARFAAVLCLGAPEGEFYAALKSDPSQTCLDVAFNLSAAGLYAEGARLLEGLDANARSLSPMVYYTLGSMYDALGEKEKAAASDAKAASAPPCEFFPSRVEEIAVLRRVLCDNPRDGLAAYLLGCLLYDKANHAEAACRWKQATENAPDFYIPYRNLAVAYFSHLGRGDEALPLLKKAVELHPHDEQLLYETALVMARLGVPGEERFDYLNARLPEGKLRDDLTLELARAKNQAGDYQGALKVLLGHTFVPCEGGEHAVATQYMFAKFALGRKALAAGRAEEALALFKESQQLPKSLGAGLWNNDILVPYRYYEAKALELLGRSDEAAALRKDILRHAGGGSEFVYYYALCARENGDPLAGRRFMDNALYHWERAIGEEDAGYFSATPFFISYCDDPKRLRVSLFAYLIGLVKLYTDDQEGAKKCFAESLAAIPDNLSVLLELSLI